MKKIAILGLVIGLLMMLFVFDRLENFQIAYGSAEEISFTSSGHKLSGTLYLPDSPPPITWFFLYMGMAPKTGHQMEITSSL